jgi:neurotransmitter:Na+ symporter, NSS family
VREESREHWNNKLGFILAAIGSAVGIGNIWRFSSVVGQNGGGAYLIPYFLAVFAFGVPLMILELSIGRHFQTNVVSTFCQVKKKFRYFGWLIFLLAFLLLSYYLVITGWTLGYLVSSVGNLDMTFSDFTSSYQPLFYFGISVICTGIVVSFGVKKGIERIVKILVPFSFLILLVLAVFSATLSGFGEGLDFFFSPDFSVLSDPLLWIAAFGQAFFSLSVGFGTLITYGSYLDKKINIPQSSVVITVFDLLVALLAGIIIFPMVFTFNLAPTLGAELAFSTLPIAFGLMPQGQLFASLFFLLLFFAALTSAIGILELNVSVVMDTKKLSRKKTSLLLTVLLFFVGLPAALSYTSLNLTIAGIRVLDFMDESLGTMGLPIMALCIALVFTWFMDKKVLAEAVSDAAHWQFTVLTATKYVIPVVLILVILSSLAFRL